jgi:hypothetical protein
MNEALPVNARRAFLKQQEETLLQKLKAVTSQLKQLSLDIVDEVFTLQYEDLWKDDILTLPRVTPTLRKRLETTNNAAYDVPIGELKQTLLGATYIVDPVDKDLWDADATTSANSTEFADICVRTYVVRGRKVRRAYLVNE